MKNKEKIVAIVVVVIAIAVALYVYNSRQEQEKIAGSINLGFAGGEYAAAILSRTSAASLPVMG